MKYSVTNIICKLGLIGCLFSGLYGCYSLDEEVYSEFVSDDFFQNIEQLQTAAMGMYLPYSRANTFEYHFLTLTSSATKLRSNTKPPRPKFPRTSYSTATNAASPPKPPSTSSSTATPRTCLTNSPWSSPSKPKSSFPSRLKAPSDNHTFNII